MPTYLVTRKSDAAEVYRYQAGAPVEWAGMAFATHEHAPLDAPEASGAPGAPAVLTKLAYLRRFTQDERVAIRAAAAVSPQLHDYLELLALADEVSLGDPDTRAALALLEAAGLIGAGRAIEILGEAR